MSFENKLLRSVFRSKMLMLLGRKELHIEELHKLYSSPNIISVIRAKMIKCRTRVICVKGLRIVYKICVRIPERKRELGRLWCGLGERITLK
jgi:hypothetical protein